MKVLKKIAVVLLSLALLILLLNLGLDYWISRQVPIIINEKKDSPYTITYSDLDVSLLHRTIFAQNVILRSKTTAVNSKKKNGIYAEIKRVEIKGFRFWSLISSDNIEARSLFLTNPKIIVYQKNEKAINHPESIRLKVVAPFRKIVLVSNVYLDDGDLKIMHISNNKPILSVNNISLKLEDIKITDAILKKKIPFSYRTYAFNCDSIYYRPNKFYHLQTNQVQTTYKGLVVKKISIIPQYSRKTFVKIIPKEKDMYTVKANELQIRNMEWGFDKTDRFFFHTNSILIGDATANIYRGKMPPDDPDKKFLYNRLLRDIPFDLTVDTLKVRNSFLEYEEEKSFEKGAGSIAISNLNLTARRLTSAFGMKKVPDVVINATGKFMKVSPMKVLWSFNVLDKTDGFRFKASIGKLSAETMTPFIKPYMNITAEGMVDQVHFNFSGNDKLAKGNFGIDYDDLKFTVYQKKDSQKKNKFLTFVSRIFVKKETKEKVKDTQVEVERIPEKSFYNLLWRTIQEALKKILL